ncbi:hypothetical protein HGRIS_011309 [Hohenbuehelia grisea]|uniref:Uncharacterized protein n=1 Tax=Hohenbuehelia grisea TaxID=104357 RepID=A0ABR3JUN4_9AGAR
MHVLVQRKELRGKDRPFRALASDIARQGYASSSCACHSTSQRRPFFSGGGVSPSRKPSAAAMFSSRVDTNMTSRLYTNTKLRSLDTAGVPEEQGASSQQLLY